MMKVLVIAISIEVDKRYYSLGFELLRNLLYFDILISLRSMTLNFVCKDRP